MTMKEKFLFVWILVVMACSFFFSHFWSCAVRALQNVVALHVVSPSVLAKLAAAFIGIHILP